MEAMAYSWKKLEHLQGTNSKYISRVDRLEVFLLKPWIKYYKISDKILNDFTKFLIV